MFTCCKLFQLGVLLLLLFASSQVTGRRKSRDQTLKRNYKITSDNDYTAGGASSEMSKQKPIPKRKRKKNTNSLALRKNRRSTVTRQQNSSLQSFKHFSASTQENLIPEKIQLDERPIYISWTSWSSWSSWSSWNPFDDIPVTVYFLILIYVVIN